MRIFRRNMPTHGEEWRFGRRCASSTMEATRQLRSYRHGPYRHPAGPGRELLSIIIFLSCIIGAALWAQWWKDRRRCCAPMGFYGAMLGATLGCSCAHLFGVSMWLVWAVISLAAPWIQGIGRLRCLVRVVAMDARPSRRTEFAIRHSAPEYAALRILAGVSV